METFLPFSFFSSWAPPATPIEEEKKFPFLHPNCPMPNHTRTPRFAQNYSTYQRPSFEFREVYFLWEKAMNEPFSSKRRRKCLSLSTGSSAHLSGTGCHHHHHHLLLLLLLLLLLPPKPKPMPPALSLSSSSCHAASPSVGGRRRRWHQLPLLRYTSPSTSAQYVHTHTFKPPPKPPHTSSSSAAAVGQQERKWRRRCNSSGPLSQEGPLVTSNENRGRKIQFSQTKSA